MENFYKREKYLRNIFIKTCGVILMILGVLVLPVRIIDMHALSALLSANLPNLSAIGFVLIGLQSFIMLSQRGEIKV